MVEPNICGYLRVPITEIHNRCLPISFQLFSPLFFLLSLGYFKANLRHHILWSQIYSLSFTFKYPLYLGVYLTGTEQYGWLCWGGDAAFWDGIPSSLCPEWSPSLAVTCLWASDSEAQEMQLETRGETQGWHGDGLLPGPLDSAVVCDLSKGKTLMGRFLAELGVRESACRSCSQKHWEHWWK